MAKGVTQGDMILDYVKQFGSISSMEAFADLGITRLSARIFDLERSGYRFTRTQESVKNRYGDKVYYTRYSLRGQNDGR